VIINSLPDGVLLEIFDFCIEGLFFIVQDHARTWRALIHECRLWRCVVFASPRHLDLRITCSQDRSEGGVRCLADPTYGDRLIATGSKERLGPLQVNGTDNIVAALEHNDRICQISLSHTKFATGKICSSHCGNKFFFQGKTEGTGLTNQTLIRDVGKGECIPIIIRPNEFE
jgi:hypothetical protein